MRVAVVGAGLAGLACAVDLVRAGADVTVFEARDRVGGRVWSAALPDGARFERGGEFVETGYDHMLRRAAEHGLAVAPQGFEFAAREVRADGRSLPGLLLEAERALAATVDALGAAAGAISAAEALDRTALEPLARLALTRRLTGTYTVELESVSASWLASHDARAAGTHVELPSSRLAAGNDALAHAMAAELAGRIRLGCAAGALEHDAGGVTLVSQGARDRFEHAVVAVPLPLARDLLPELSEREGYRRLRWGDASKLHVPLTAPAPPGAVQGLGSAFWTWTALGPDGAAATFASSFAGGRDAVDRLGRADAGAWQTAIRELRPELGLAAAGEAVMTSWGAEQHTRGAYSCQPPGWSALDDAGLAAPCGRIQLAGEHTAGDFCGTMEGALRSGARAAAALLAASSRGRRGH